MHAHRLLLPDSPQDIIPAEYFAQKKTYRKCLSSPRVGFVLLEEYSPPREKVDGGGGDCFFYFSGGYSLWGRNKKKSTHTQTQTTFSRVR